MTAVIALFVLGCMTVLFALRLSVGTLRAPDSGFFPLVLGVMLIALAVLQGVQLHLAARGAKAQAPDEPRSQDSPWRVALFFGVVALATALFDTLGYVLVSFLLMLGLLQVLGLRKWYVSGLIALLSAVAAQIVFVHWLKIPLPEGLLAF